MKNTINKILLAVLPIMVILLLLDRCSLIKKVDAANSQITQLQLDNQTLSTITNKQGEVITTQSTIITDSKEALGNLTDSIFDLKRKNAKHLKTIAYYKSITHTDIDSVPVPYVDTLAMKEWEDSVRMRCNDVIAYYEANTVTVPRDAYDSTDNYTISATVRRDSLIINSISIPDTLQLRFVEKKAGLFKRPTIEVQFFHSNPLITTTQANSAIYRAKRKPLFSKVVPILVGIGIGIILNR